MTPAHSHIDYELSRRHDLPLVHIFDDDGRLINVPQHFLVIPDMFFLLIAVYFTLYQLYKISKANVMAFAQRFQTLEPIYTVLCKLQCCLVLNTTVKLCFFVKI